MGDPLLTDENAQTLQDGEKQARKFSKTLESVATRVVEFRDKWQQRAEEAMGELKDSIKRLEIDIRELAKRSVAFPNSNLHPTDTL